MTKVHAIAPHHAAIEAPSELRRLQGWLLWRLESFEGEDKPRKVPYYAEGGRRVGKQGSPEDRAKLTGFAAAKAAAARRGMDGVGLALLPEFDFAVLDFDNCIGPNGEMPSEVADIVSRTYSEYSPSGNGIHSFVRGKYGDRKSPTAGNAYGFETFSNSGFLTFTGNILPVVNMLGYHDTIANLDAQVSALCSKRFTSSAPAVMSDDFTLGFKPRLGLSIERMEELLSALDPSMGREDWIRVGMALHHECEGDDTGFYLWDTWSSAGATYPGSEGLRVQWDSFTRRDGPGRVQTTMASVIHMANKATRVPFELDRREEVLARAEAFMADKTDNASVGRFGPVPMYELAKRPPGEWLVKGVLPASQLYCIYGASGSGKTFVALDMAFSIAMGIPWRGCRSKRGKVVIIAAEGGANLGKRGEAYARHHNIDLRDVDMHVITAAPNFLEEMDVAEVIAEVKALGDVRAVFVDTVAQVSPGANENTSEDMGRVLASMRLMNEATGALIVAVHHAGKDPTKGARGWSGFRAAMDGQMEVTRSDDGSRELRLDKMKDGEDGLRWGFKLEIIDVGVDADGDTITSCVAVEAELAAPKDDASDRKAIVRFGNMERHVLEVIEMNHASSPSVALGVLMDECVAALSPPEAGKRDIRRQSVQRAIQSLAKRKDGPIEIKNGSAIFCI